MAIVVETTKGPIAGDLSPDGAVAIFRGVPFAMPPVGPRRWRAPEPMEPWAGVRAAREPRPIAPQFPLPPDSLIPLGDEKQSEDCLTLNLWGPGDPEGRRLPVIVWLHLGAFQFGSGSAPIYDGENWPRAGAVMVTPNYRLNKFGFLAHPALSREQGGRSGNYGLLDQIAALEWVRDNIARFGGDPDRVTVAGVSAGSSSVTYLMGSPLARGLFHRAIAESGGSFGGTAERTGVGDRWQTLADAERLGEIWASDLGAASAEELRALPADQVRVASEPNWTDTAGTFDVAQPIIDGRVVLADSRTVFVAGDQAPVPLLVGSAANEDLLLPFSPDLAAYRSQAEADFGPAADRFMALYPATTDEEAIAATMLANSHRLFTWQNWTMARLHAAAGHDTYYYRFEQAPPVPDVGYPEQNFPRPLGAFHGASLFYSFGRFDLRDWPWSEDDRRLAALVTAAWVALAATGNPTSAKPTSGLPHWPSFDPAAPAMMRLNAAPALDGVPDRDRLAFWDEFYGFDADA